jgi:protein-disulfide isomerase
MSNRFLAIVIAVIIGLGAIFWFTHNKANTSGSNSGNSSQATNHVSGTGSKGVTMLEYGDFQCPVCGSYYSTVKTVAEKYKNDIYFQFRNLPLQTLHANAFAAARTAEAADKQGKYWQMHDMLYEQQSTWAETNNAKTYFESYAQQLGMDVKKFDEDFASSEVNNSINADIAAFKQTNEQMATPSFFIDGKFIDLSKLRDANGYPSVDQFSKVIDEAIAQKSKNS